MQTKLSKTKKLVSLIICFLLLASVPTFAAINSVPTENDQIVSDQINSNQKSSDQILSDQTDSNLTNFDQADPNQIDPNQTNSDQTGSNQIAPDQTDPDQTDPDQADTDQADTLDREITDWSELIEPDAHISTRAVPVELEGLGTEKFPYLIYTERELYSIPDQTPLSDHYKLMNDIDLHGVVRSPLGVFNGVFDGNNKVISNLSVSAPGQAGLFRAVAYGEVKDLTIVNANIEGTSAGGLAATIANTAEVNNVDVIDSTIITTSNGAGGLTGTLIDSTMIKCRSVNNEIYGPGRIGGLIGETSSQSVIEECLSSSRVEGSGTVGGLIGISFSAYIIHCYAEGDIVSAIGGGLIGAMGTVQDPPQIIYCYANMTFSDDVKYGLAGERSSTISSYFNNDKANIITGPFTVTQARTTSEMKQKSTFVGWDFENVWYLDEGNDFPRLKYEPDSSTPIPEEPEDMAVISITLDPADLELSVGDTATISPVFNPVNATNKNVHWGSSNPNVATVDENGNITAVGEGFTVIVVVSESGFKMGYCNLTVIVNERLVISPSSHTMSAGTTFQINAEIVPASSKTIRWKSSNPNVLTVYKGKVTAKAAGVATVTAYTDDGLSAECVITVE